MRKQPLVTIGMPVFNGGRYLKYSVISILKQSYTNWELLLLDDGSSDDAFKQLEVISDHRIKIIRDGKNLGLARRLNQLVWMARGTFFARMDHDDIAYTDRLLKQVEYLSQNTSVDLIGANCITINEDNHMVGKLPYINDYAALIRQPWLGFYLPHPTWLGRIEWFRKNPYLDSPAPYCAEDQELLLRTYTHSHFHNLSQVLLAYRVKTQINLKKMFKTRYSLWKVQKKYFYSKSQYLYLFLCTLTFFLRVLKDLSCKLKFIRRRPNIDVSLSKNFKELDDFFEKLRRSSQEKL